MLLFLLTGEIQATEVSIK